MEYRQLGQSNFSISRLAFGCSPASSYDYGPVDEREWVTTVHTALDCGINFFDVADVYGFGRAEELLSVALGGRRREVVIATKCGLVWDQQGRVHQGLRRQDVLRALEGSLQRLKLDAIPLYQIHWPDPATPVEETMETLARCQEQGKIRSLGVCNFSRELLKQAQQACRLESEQVAYNLLCREAEGEIFTWCETTRISILAHTGLARGLLAGKRPLGTRFDGTDSRKHSAYFSEQGQPEKQRLLDAIGILSKKIGRGFASIAIRWVLDAPQVTAVLVGIKNRTQLKENLEAVGWRLAPEDRELLSKSSAACPNGLAGVPAHGAASR